jgi:hypothetical protein
MNVQLQPAAVRQLDRSGAGFRFAYRGIGQRHGACWYFPVGVFLANKSTNKFAGLGRLAADARDRNYPINT